MSGYKKHETLTVAVCRQLIFFAQRAPVWGNVTPLLEGVL